VIDTCPGRDILLREALHARSELLWTKRCPNKRKGYFIEKTAELIENEEKPSNNMLVLRNYNSQHHANTDSAIKPNKKVRMEVYSMIAAADDLPLSPPRGGADAHDDEKQRLSVAKILKVNPVAAGSDARNFAWHSINSVQVGR
jgi:hypothetical protein